MCRHAAYIGPSVTLAEVVRDLDHSLLHQSYQARELLTGSVCADGYGIGWYPDGETTQAARYAFPGPIWSDGNLGSIGPAIRSNLIVSAVRNATLPGHNTEANCAPFQEGRYLGSLNGYLEPYPADWGPELAATPSRGNSDGEWLFRAIVAATDASDSAGLASATQEICRQLIQHARENNLVAQLNLIVSDGEQIVATRAGSEPSQNSLYVLRDGTEFPDGTLIASEPIYDDAQWDKVAQDTLVVARQGAPLVRLRI